MAFFVFLGCFSPYVGQPHGHIGWATSMAFAPFNSTNPRTTPWNFQNFSFRIGDFEKCTFFESAILNFFFQKKKIFFAEFLPKHVKVYWLARNFRNFDDYPGLQPMRSLANTYAQHCTQCVLLAPTLKKMHQRPHQYQIWVSPDW